jgi:DNA-binding NtrC family response regulator
MNRDPAPPLPILLVDDQPAAIKALEWSLRAQGLNHFVACQDSREVLPLLAGREFELVLLDLGMPPPDGRELLRRISHEHPELPVIIITATDSVEVAVECVKEGAFDYIVKPAEQDRLVQCVQRALELRELRRQVGSLQKQILADRLEHPGAFAGIVTRDPAMLNIFKYIEAIAGTAHPVLITGETGAGKELVARAIHRASGRRGAFVAVNVAGLDDTLFADALFGHLRGAYTSATEERRGLVERAAAGTLFLDEIGDLSSASQVKLLRLVQEREYFPLGADTPKVTDARLLISTHQDLEALQAKGQFRKDLYFRVGAHHLHIPPLRERLGDLPLLVDHFVAQAAQALNRAKPALPPQLLTLLARYSFPGNVRELETMIHDAVSRQSGGPLALKHFEARFGKSELRAAAAMERHPPALIFPAQLPTIQQAVELLITEALARSAGNQRAAAKLLGISQPALSMRLKKYQQERPR